ncbi:MAG: LUD domain-containing protein [Syntrophobacteraceae bacterium]
MSTPDMLDRYARTALAGGTLVELITADRLPGRLASILSELEPSCIQDYSSNGSQFLMPPPGSQRPARAPCRRIAALPASDWPQGMRESVETILTASGYETVMPRKGPHGYTWDRDRLAGALVGITWCSEFIADTGSLVLPAGPGTGTLAALLPEVHLALSHVEGCRAGLADCLRAMSCALPSRLTFITGPSRTGDIEATMTPGVHGPRKVLHLILI